MRESHVSRNRNATITPIGPAARRFRLSRRMAEVGEWVWPSQCRRRADGRLRVMSSRRILRPSVCAALATLVSLVAACAPPPFVAELGTRNEAPDVLAVELAAARHLLTEYADLEVMLHP